MVMIPVIGDSWGMLHGGTNYAYLQLVLKNRKETHIKSIQMTRDRMTKIMEYASCPTFEIRMSGCSSLKLYLLK